MILSVFYEQKSCFADAVVVKNTQLEIVQANDKVYITGGHFWHLKGPDRQDPRFCWRYTSKPKVVGIHYSWTVAVHWMDVLRAQMSLTFTS